MKNILLIFAILITTAYALSPEVYLENGLSVRTRAYDGAGLIPGNAQWVYENPASIGDATGLEANYSMTKKWSLLSETYGSTAFPLFTGRMALTYFRSESDEMVLGTIYDPTTTFINYTGKNYQYASDLMMLTYAQPLSKELTLAANFKRLGKTLGTIDSSAYGLDLGSWYKLTNDLSLGLNIHNAFSTSFQWSEDSESIPMEFWEQIRYSYSPLINTSISLKENNGGFDYTVGVDGSLDNALFYQAAYNQNMIGVGLGVKFDNYSLDYAYNSYLAGDGLLDSVHSFGLTCEFGATNPPVQVIDSQQIPVPNMPVNQNIPTIRPAIKVQGNLSKEIETSATGLTRHLDFELQYAPGKWVIKGQTAGITPVTVDNQTLKIRPDQRFYTKQVSALTSIHAL